VRLAVAHVDESLLVHVDTVRPAELILERIAHGSVAALARSEDNGNHAALQVDAANRVALGVGNVDSAVARIGDPLGAGELGLLGWTAIACVAFLARAGEMIDFSGLRIDPD
jgi:hypothetical protein